MRMTRRAALIGSAASVLLANNAFGQSGTPIKIGSIYAIKTLLGEHGNYGNQTAIEFIRQDGGVLGRPLEVATYDSNQMPAQGVSAAQRLFSRDATKVIVGEINSTVALAIMPIVQSQNGLFVVASAKHPDVTKSEYAGVLRLNTDATLDNEQFNPLLQKITAGKKVAVVAENTDHGQLQLRNVKSIVGDRVVFSDLISVQQSDLTSIATNLKGSAAEVVYLSLTNPEQYASILGMISQLGYKPQVVIGPGLLSMDGVKLAGAAAEGAISADIYSDMLDSPLNRRFVEAYQKRAGIPPNKVSALAFESVWIVAQAMKRAGTADDIAKIVATLRQNTWETPRGTIRFDAKGQAIGPDLIPLKVQGGKIVPMS